MLNFPRKATNMINKQLQIDKNSSEKALDYKEEAARILQSSKTEDDLIEKYRKHFTCSHYPPVQSSLAQGGSSIEKKSRRILTSLTSWRFAEDQCLLQCTPMLIPDVGVAWGCPHGI